MKGRLVRAKTRLRRASGRTSEIRTGRRVLSIGVCVFAGFMIATSAINAGGTDLRPNRNTDLVGLIGSESKHNKDLAERVAALRRPRWTPHPPSPANLR